jgi:hypothetical protein
MIDFWKTVLSLREQLRARTEQGLSESKLPSLPKRYRTNNP